MSSGKKPSIKDELNKDKKFQKLLSDLDKIQDELKKEFYRIFKDNPEKIKRVEKYADEFEKNPFEHI